jgi:hypothetical protein
LSRFALCQGNEKIYFAIHPSIPFPISSGGSSSLGCQPTEPNCNLTTGQGHGQVEDLNSGSTFFFFCQRLEQCQKREQKKNQRTKEPKNQRTKEQKNKRTKEQKMNQKREPLPEVATAKEKTIIES